MFEILLHQGPHVSTCSCGKSIESGWNRCPNCGESLNIKSQKSSTLNISGSVIGGKTSVKGADISAKLIDTVFGDDLDISGDDDVSVKADNIRVVGGMNIVSNSGQGMPNYSYEHSKNTSLENVAVGGNLTIAETLITLGEGPDAIFLPVAEWLKKLVEKKLPSDGNYTATDIDELIFTLDDLLNKPQYSDNASAAAEVLAYKAALLQKRGNKPGPDGRRMMDVALERALARNPRQELALKLKAYYNLNKWKQLTLVWKPGNKNRLNDTVYSLEKYLNICRNKISVADKLQATEKLMSCLFILQDDPSDGEQSKSRLLKIIDDLSEDGLLDDSFPNWHIWRKRINAQQSEG